jgi:hypothetical protein
MTSVNKVQRDTIRAMNHKLELTGTAGMPEDKVLDLLVKYLCEQNNIDRADLFSADLVVPPVFCVQIDPVLDADGKPVYGKKIATDLFFFWRASVIAWYKELITPPVDSDTGKWVVDYGAMATSVTLASAVILGYRKAAHDIARALFSKRTSKKDVESLVRDNDQDWAEVLNCTARTIAAYNATPQVGTIVKLLRDLVRAELKLSRAKKAEIAQQLSDEIDSINRTLDSEYGKLVACRAPIATTTTTTAKAA